jgi:hypothetical protein
MLHVDGYQLFPRWLCPIPTPLMKEIYGFMHDGHHEFTVRDTLGIARRVLQDFPKHRFGGMIFRYTPATCQMMEPHCDSEITHEVFGLADDEIPLTLLIAIDDYTMIDLWPGSHRQLRAKDPKDLPQIGDEYQARMYLYEGDALLMRGDLFHSGPRSSGMGPKRVLTVHIDHPKHKRDPCASCVLHKVTDGSLRIIMKQNSPQLSQ